MNELLPSAPDYDGRTLYFPTRSHSVRLTQSTLPAGYRLAVRDERLFKQSFDYESTISAFFTEENAMKHTLGAVILHEDQIVCEAATGAPTHGRIEVGVTTHDAYRGLGLASIACARLIEMCEAKGYETWWDCAKQNLPSVKLAHKLGFHHEREYRYVLWSGHKA
jgi:RimJ/RimL family protein N-acetyltransferase